jgi:hypothetical protein
VLLGLYVTLAHGFQFLYSRASLTSIARDTPELWYYVLDYATEKEEEWPHSFTSSSIQELAKIAQVSKPVSVAALDLLWAHSASLDAVYSLLPRSLRSVS